MEIRTLEKAVNPNLVHIKLHEECLPSVRSKQMDCVKKDKVESLKIVRREFR